MTKEFQQELKEKLKAGIKPSHLKKSKSTGDLPQAQTPSPQPKRKSLEISPSSPSLKVQLTEAQDQISILALKLETCQRELTELNSLTAENTHLKEQAKIKQRQMESLRQQLEAKTSELTQTKQELDKSLEARHQGLKD